MKKGSKMTDEQRKRVSVAHIGNKGFWTGKKRDVETNKKISDKKKGIPLGKWTQERLDSNRKMIIERQKLRTKPYYDTLEKKIRQCFKYRQWRSDIFTRDDYTCQICGIKGGYIVADHIKPFSVILKEYKIENVWQALDCQELWNINNGRTICYQCDLKSDTFGGRAINYTKKLGSLQTAL